MFLLLYVFNKTDLAEDEGYRRVKEKYMKNVAVRLYL